MEVYNELGYGFLEKVYENALMVLFRQGGIEAQQQKMIPVFFRNEKVGDYYADILVEGKIVIEIKSVSHIADAHRAQVLNYLKGTSLKLGIILNFAKSDLIFERFVL